jgi:hypothetical protein
MDPPDVRVHISLRGSWEAPSTSGDLLADNRHHASPARPKNARTGRPRLVCVVGLRRRFGAADPHLHRMAALEAQVHSAHSTHRMPVGCSTLWRMVIPDLLSTFGSSHRTSLVGDWRIVLRRLASIEHAVVTHHLNHADVLCRGIREEPVGKLETGVK